MADAGKYYWIKLRTDFFAEDSPIDFLLSQKNGAEYVALYIKLCLATANTGGKMCRQIGEVIIPYDVEKISRDMKHFSVDTVRVAMELYKRLGLIYEEADGMLAIANHSEMVGSETKWAKYKREKRIGQSLDNVQQRLEIRDKSIDNRDIDNKDNNGQRKRFTPPTIDEVKAYIAEKGYQVDANKWLAHYESNGWKVGKNSMKDWKASIRYWASQDKPKATAVVDDWMSS